MSRLIKTWQVPEKWDGHSVKSFIFDHAQFSRQLFKRVKEEGKVLLNNRSTELWTPLQTHDKVTVHFPIEKRGERIFPEEGPLSIVFEDEDLIVIDKPAGLAVTPSIDRTKTSVANRLLHYYDKQGISSTVHIVTRLDRDTSGLMVVAKHAYSHMMMTKKMKLVNRRYKAIVSGVISQDEGMIDEPIARSEGSIIRRRVSEEGKASRTIFRTEEKYKAFTLVDLELLTGRTHQIRVHMSYIGHPLAGDTLYGGTELEFLTGQALHCHALEFNHPWTKERMLFTTELPASWKKFRS